VDFKLNAPMGAVVEGVLKGGHVVSFKVTPANRTKYVHIAACTAPPSPPAAPPAPSLPAGQE